MEQTVTSDMETRAVARAKLESVDNNRIVVSVPGTDYQLRLTLTVPADQIDTPPGKRIKGVIEARALRAHNFSGGGTWIEPVWGEPRIVAGQVIGHDEQNNRVLLHAVLPIWVSLEDSQQPSDFSEGQMINFYVESGTTLTPVV